MFLAPIPEDLKIEKTEKKLEEIEKEETTIEKNEKALHLKTSENSNDFGEKKEEKEGEEEVNNIWTSSGDFPIKLADS
ncbi:hypothetical protein B9Z55_023124 [Caenorhabditis nigoni]|uniref:Uncharacterized protein n=1 Tax=Caenorhabditis nigoni TaxID=1611254 RepID=A0A2G5SNX6_9PELO|nr:hypothetical protein B9Z55_023124 [Caenorhabditis nigoni]